MERAARRHNFPKSPRMPKFRVRAALPNPLISTNGGHRWETSYRSANSLTSNSLSVKSNNRVTFDDSRCGPCGYRRSHLIIETAISLSMVAELRAIWRAGAGGSRGRFRWPDLFHDPGREAARDFANGTSPLFSFHRRDRLEPYRSARRQPDSTSISAQLGRPGTDSGIIALLPP